MTQRTCRELRRLRARHPPPHQRRDGQPRARRARPRGDARCPTSRSRRRPPGRRAAARSPSARSSARSPPSRAAPTPRGRRPRRCSTRSGPRRRRVLQPTRAPRRLVEVRDAATRALAPADGARPPHGALAPAGAAEPPDQDDPCARAGKKTCGTTGKGSYRTYEFGPRWFGDFRGAVPGVDGPTFCIDLRFWYPSRSFGYEKRSAEGLRNRDGDALSASALRRMSYAHVALRALRQRDAAGRGDALRPQADGRRGAGRGHAAGAQCAQPRHLQADPARGEALRRSLPGPGDAARGARRRPRGRGGGRGPRRGGAPRARRRGRRSTATGADRLPETVDTGRAGPRRSPSRRPTRAPASRVRARAADLPADLPMLVRARPSASRRATRSGWSRPPARRSPSRRARR